MSAGIFTGIGPAALGAAGRPSSSEGETLATRSRVGCTLRAAPARSANYLLAAMEPRPQPQSRLTSRWCHGLGSCRPDTRTLWWGVQGGTGSWVPICLGDHVWVSPLASRLGCPISSGLKIKAPARSVASPHMSDTPIFPRHTGFFWARKARFVNINKRHIRQVQTLTAESPSTSIVLSTTYCTSTIPVQWL